MVTECVLIGRPRQAAVLQWLKAARCHLDGVDAPPTASMCQGGGVEQPPGEASMGQASTIGLDIAKRVFQAHGAAATGRVVFRKRLVRTKVLEFSRFSRAVLWRWRLVAGRP